LFRIYRICLLFKDIICFHVALYIEHIPMNYNENKNWSFSTQKYIPSNSAIQKKQKNHIVSDTVTCHLLEVSVLHRHQIYTHCSIFFLYKYNEQYRWIICSHMCVVITFFFFEIENLICEKIKKISISNGGY
jgi:hypothetical protein